jgi:phage terminase large subunit GpA-like protein
MDEIDGYEPTPEGDPVELLSQRAATFGEDRLVLKSSTPTKKGFSAIEKSYESGDQRRRFVPCLHCEEMQILKWSGVKWEKDPETDEHLPETAYYVCEHCGGILTDGDRLQMLQRGEWRAKKPFRGHASYHLNELYSTFSSLESIVRSFLSKKEKNDLQTFVNVSLAETWEDGGKSVPHETLFLRRREFPAEVPAEYCVLTAAVDVQDDRVEIGVEAWGEGERNARIDLIILHGDLSQRDFWTEDVEGALSGTYRHESGVDLRIACATIDSGGHFTNEVYKFVKPRERRRIYAIKGKNGTGYPIINRPSRKNKGKVTLFSIGTDTAKELIFKRYEIEKPGPGYIDFPIRQCFDEEYFEQLVAEKQVTYYRKGFPVTEWRKTRPRNEGLDLSVYNLAALYILNPNFKKLSEKLQAVVEVDDSGEDEGESSSIESAFSDHKKKSRRSPRRRGYVKSWR